MSKLLKDSPSNIHEVVQYVFRTDSEGEEKQIQLLKKHPGPRILIGTPTRILDILSSQYKSTLPLFNLSSIVLDEADVLIPKGKVFTVLKRTNGSESDRSKLIPTQILLNYIIPWRNSYARENNKVFTPLKFLIESSNASNYLKVVAMKNKWITGRPMLRLGTDTENNVKEQLPNDICNYFVTYNPLTGDLTDTDLDISKALPNLDSNALKIVSELNNRRVYQHLKEYSSLNESARTTLLQVYSDALVKTMKLADGASDSVKSLKKRALVVVPEAYSIPTFLSVLEKSHGIKGASVLTKENDCRFFYTSELGDEISIDTQTFFKEQPFEEFEDGVPDVLVVRARQVAGMDFPGLNRIYALGWDSISLPKLYFTVAGRSRAAPAQEKGQVGAVGLWKSPEDQQQGKFVVISLIENTNDIRYNVLIAGSMATLSVKQTRFFH